MHFTTKKKKKKKFVFFDLCTRLGSPSRHKTSQGVLLKNVCTRVYAGGAQPEHRQMSCPLLHLHVQGACCRRPPTPECAEAVTGGDALSLPR